MHSRFFQCIGWVSVLLSFGLAGVSDQGRLTAAATLWGGALGVLGFLLALFGQYTAVLHERQAGRRAQHIPIRTDDVQPSRTGRRRRR